jgi:hypothetical protein
VHLGIFTTSDVASDVLDSRPYLFDKDSELALLLSEVMWIFHKMHKSGDCANPSQVMNAVKAIVQH